MNVRSFSVTLHTQKCDQTRSTQCATHEHQLIKLVLSKLIEILRQFWGADRLLNVSLQHKQINK